MFHNDNVINACYRNKTDLLIVPSQGTRQWRTDFFFIVKCYVYSILLVTSYRCTRRKVILYDFVVGVLAAVRMKIKKKIVYFIYL